MAKILCVEDETDIRADIVEELQDAGYQTVEADDGAAGLAAIKQHKPDLVLCDITMPRMNGHELLKELRANHPQFADLPFVFLSALADRTDVLTGIDVGADDYLTKPIDFELMLARVRMSLRHLARINEKKNSEHVKLYKALTQGSQTAPQVPARPPPQPSAPASQALRPVLGDCLPRILERVKPGSAGKLHFINLAQLKDELGGEWDELSEKAIAIAENVIKRNLTSGDLYDRNGDHAFILVFPDLTQQQAHFKSETIANEICDELLGTNAAQYQNLSLTTSSLDLSGLAGSKQPVGVADLASAFDQQSKQSGQAESSNAGFVSRLLSQVTLSYQPMWNAEDQAVIAYRAVPYRATNHGVLSSDQVLQGGVHDPLAKDLNAFVITETKRLLRHMGSGPSTVPVAIPLNFPALIAGHTQDVLEAFARGRNGCPNDALMVDLRGFEDFVTNTSTSRALTFLRNAIGPIVIEGNPDSRYTEDLARHGVSHLATGYQAAGDAAAEFERLSAFAKRTCALGLQPYVHSVDTVGAVKSVVKAGVRVLSGQAIAADVEVPQGAKRLARRSVLGSC